MRPFPNINFWIRLVVARATIVSAPDVNAAPEAKTQGAFITCEKSELL